MKIYYRRDLTEKSRYNRNHPIFAEKIFWNIVKGKQLGYDFHRQKPIDNFIFDFYCYDLQLVVEIDGITHLDESVKQNDIKKENFIKSIGFRIIRFTDEEITGNANLVEKKIKRNNQGY